MDEQTSVAVRLDAGEADAEELAELTARLRRELLLLDVDAVEHATAGEAPPGAKGVELFLVGSLIVSLGRSAGKLGSLVRTIQDWVSLGGDRTVKLELDGDTIELTGATSKDQQRLVDLWIERHAAPG
jgi:hypothetical protein